MKTLEYLLKRLDEVAVEGIKIVEEADGNTYLSDVLKLKQDQAEICKKIHQSAERGFEEEFIDETKKREVQKIALEDLTTLLLDAKMLVNSLNKLIA